MKKLRCKDIIFFNAKKIKLFTKKRVIYHDSNHKTIVESEIFIAF